MNRTAARRDPELEAQLAEHLGDAGLGHPVHAFQSVPTTMAIAHELADVGSPEGTLVWAARQEQGTGRLGRTWISPQGGVYSSLILRPTRPAAEIPQLSLVAGLATIHTIQDLTHLFPRVRWPNDVLLPAPAIAKGGPEEYRKVAGILVEAKNGAVVVGIGINVNSRAEELPETAISLAAVGGDSISLYRVTGALCQQMQAWYAVWNAQGFPPIRDALRSRMASFGQPVQITAGSTQSEGTSQDLDEFGRLLVRLDSGIVQAFEMGEVTLLR